MKHIFSLSSIAAIGILFGLSFTVNDDAAATPPCDGFSGLYPDLQTVVPTHLQLVNSHQKEILRFSNGIANTGDGDWRMRPEFQDLFTIGIQEILDVNRNIVCEQLVSTFEFHPAHNHWHLDDIALFEVRKDSPTGDIVGTNSIKVTFCLIDWYKLVGNSPTTDRIYFACERSYQGISPGWVDQYHHSTEGQQLDMTGAPPGTYYLVSTSNPDGIYLEKDKTNNMAWTSFQLKRDSNGNAKIKIVGHSDCVTSSGLCGENSPNR